ncbi:MAG: hypothetical protein KAS49_00015 [Candidatus Cloacimonetes bacterium]|nr:hypothetical protein [Candidatus Cloacimonadota bacterium]
MGTGQMLLVLLAIILFSTILLTMYNNISVQTRIIDRTKTMLQGQKLASRYFQKMEAELLGNLTTFSDIISTYNGFSENTAVNELTYHLNCERVVYCDQVGNTPVATTDFLLLEFSMWTLNSYNDTIWVGTTANPIQKIIADMEL